MKNVRQSGFTLIELMIVISIVALLAMVALPTYQESITKSRRTDAKAALSAATLNQEKYFFQFNGYTSSVNDIGGDSDQLLSPEGFYSVSLSNNVGTGTCVGGDTVRYNCYTLTATPVAGGAQADDDKCTSFAIAHRGAKTATGSEADYCW